MLEAIENSAVATFVRESPSLFGYTAVLCLHAIGPAIVVGAAKAVAAISLVMCFGVIVFGRLIVYNDTLLYALGL
jgi:hypothetical protein